MASTKKPLVGIKYCGGCNPRFNRTALVDRIKDSCADTHDFAYAEQGAFYDVLLVVCGCERGCVRDDAYRAGRVIKLTTDKNIGGNFFELADRV